MAAFRGDGFGMELDAVDRPRTVAYPHDLAVLGPRIDLEDLRHIVPFDGKTVVPRRRERVFQTGKHTRIVVMNETGFPVHEGASPDDRAAKRLADRLMAQADAENWQG